MNSPSETLATIEITDSIDVVEFDPHREVFQATFDSTRDSIDLAVITVVATITNRSLAELTPLEEVIETEALCYLFSKLSTDEESSTTVSFSYEGFDVTVFSEGRVEAAKIQKDEVSSVNYSSSNYPI